MCCVVSVSTEVSSSYSVLSLSIVLFAIVVLCAVIVIAATLFQNEDSADTDVITGVQESYYSKNKGGSRDAKLRLITIICSIVLAVCVILFFVSFKIVPPQA